MGGEIKINDIIYGTSFASGVTCDDDKTVQEKLSNAAYIDIENEEIGEIPQGDFLYTTDIIDNLESESDTHVLSAKQGKILNEKIENKENNNTLYYSTLSQAISDINNQVNTNAITYSSSAKVKVFPNNTGRTTVMLLDDVSENVEIVINKDIDLVINGKTLSFTTIEARLLIAEDVDCVIDGSIDGSIITKTLTSNHGDNIRSHIVLLNGNLEVKGCTITGNYNTSNGRAYVICSNPSSEKLILENCNISMINSNTATTEMFFRTVQSQSKEFIINNCNITTEGSRVIGVYSANNLIMNNSTVKAKETGTNNDAYSYTVYIYTGTKAIIKNSTILGDAEGCRNNDSTENYCHGIYNFGDLTLENCYVNSTFAGIVNLNNLYINGGTYIGYANGGVYAGGDGTKTYINDATLLCGHYEGDFDYSTKIEDISAALYLGTYANVTTYIDNCIIDATDNGEWAISIGAGDNALNNVLNISNCTILDNKNIHINTNEDSKLNIGVGTNITTDMIDNVEYAEFTNKCYRKNNEDKVFDGNDYNSLNERLETVRFAIDELNTNLGGFSFYNNPTVIYLVSDGSIYVDANDNYILADSVTGEILLMDTATYTTNIVEGSFYRIEGADSVSPFKKDSSEKYKHMIIDSLQNTKLELTYDSTWEEIATGLNELFP